MEVVDAICLGWSSSIKLLCNCAQKKESAFTELGLTPKHDRLIACFSPLQTKARIAAEQVDATALPHPWIGSEQGSTYSHEDHRFRYFLDHSHPSLDLPRQDFQTSSVHLCFGKTNYAGQRRQPCPYPTGARIDF
ncbi:hypothetical protein OAE57_02160 [Synechococcus sp. AH-551-C10]|nr:hypothetical protein [Synechococcus sp. AH-551-C10]MDB4659856.1 hypothetical protein [Synechococcus sp. AH-551-C10]